MFCEFVRKSKYIYRIQLRSQSTCFSQTCYYLVIYFDKLVSSNGWLKPIVVKIFFCSLYLSNAVPKWVVTIAIKSLNHSKCCSYFLPWRSSHKIWNKWKMHQNQCSRPQIEISWSETKKFPQWRENYVCTYPMAVTSSFYKTHTWGWAKEVKGACTFNPNIFPRFLTD